MPYSSPANAPRTMPPRDLCELAQRASALTGRSLAELAAQLDADALAGPSVRRKGKVGQLVERALGTSAGGKPLPDFVELGVELKTVPVDNEGRTRESTFLCTLPLADLDNADWHRSTLRKKLTHVLFVPLIATAHGVIIGAPLFWRPTAAQESILRADFDDLVGLITLGHVEALTAHLGRWLQIRPKAAHGRIRTHAPGRDGERISTIPRGFYLRARVTRALLADPLTTRYDA
jgi:DNA mismatch repair protein MutH